MKKSLTLLLIAGFGLHTSAQIIGKKSNLTDAINAAGNPALIKPYSVPSVFEDSLYEGYPIIHKKTINTTTFQLDYKGYDSYPKDANRNYTKMFWGNVSNNKLDTTTLHLLDINYTGTNATSYEIKTWHGNTYNGVRHSIATFNGNKVTKVVSMDTAYSSGSPVPSMSVDSFNYDGSGNLISRYLTIDDGTTKIVKEREFYTYSGSNVSTHKIEEWNTQTSSYTIEDEVSLYWNANNLLDSANYGDDLYRFSYDSNGKITQSMLLEDNGSGGFDPEEKTDITYNSKGKIKELKYWQYQGGNWVEAAVRTPTYDADTLVKVTETRKFGPQTVTFGEWIYGDTGTTTGPTPPAPPTNLAAALGSRAASTKAVDLTWKDNATDETGYVVERAESGAFAVHATLAADAVSYKDTTNLNESTTYKYRVYATNGAGNSANSNEISITVPVNDTAVSVTEVKGLPIQLFPNPTSGKIFIRNAAHSTLTVFNLLGNEMATIKLSESLETIETNHLDNGIYIFNIQSATKTSINRVVIKH